MIGLARSFSTTNHSSAEASTQSAIARPNPTSERASLHEAEHGGAAADDHQPFEAEIPNAGALREHAGHRHIDERRAIAERGDDEFVHHAPPAARRQRQQPAEPGAARAVMKSAIAALMMSIAAAGRPASIGR